MIHIQLLLWPPRWDTAGQEDFKEARTVCYNDTHVILIGFSFAQPDSLANVETSWVEEMKLDTLKNAPVGPTNPFICVMTICARNCLLG